jgi:hypothetical protein
MVDAAALEGEALERGGEVLSMSERNLWAEP